MITPEVIARINSLAKKQRESGLSEEEKSEQARLRRMYIDNIKTQIKDVLDASLAHEHGNDCNCGCHTKH